MWQRLYLQRLKRDLERWIEQGWVTPAHAQDILAETSGNAGIRHIPQLLALLGAILVGFAAMSFVAANWSAIPKIIKLVLLFAALWGAWGAALFAKRRNHPAYAEAAVVAGLALFGANIMLIAQIYHVTSATPAWLLLWSLVALAAAWALSSRTSLAIAFLLATLWSTWAAEQSGVHWAFFAPWVLATLLAIRLSWRPGLHLAILTFLVWSIVNADPLCAVIGCDEGDLTSLFVLAALVLWIVGLRVSARSLRFGSMLETYGMVIAFALIWTLQIQSGDSHINLIWTVLALAGFAIIGALVYGEVVSDRLAIRDCNGILLLGLGAVLYPALTGYDGLSMLIYAALFMVLSIWLITYGTRRNHRFALNAGLVAFTGECLYLYFQTLGTLLNTAAFFALGGVILIAGSLILPRIRRHLVASVEKGDAA